MAACPSCGIELVGTPKYCPECGTKLDAPAATSREARKVVTVLFSDVAGSTALGEALDPEAVRGLMSRYFAAMQSVIERHGGTVEKFIGDAVMAVFGIPTLHEDDALRSVRAAAQMREALAALNTELEAERGVQIQTRTGITTGEVVAGDPSAGQTLVTGDTVNTAARLEQAAASGEILIGEPTWRLVRDAVRAEPVEPVSAKGKALPVPAYRLVSVAAGVEGHLRRMDAPLVGRERELRLLTEAWDRAREERLPQLFTLLGAAGVGKSRLVGEFLAGVSDEARILRGRCLPYGEGITYWPLAEALRDTVGITDADDRAAALRKLQALLAGERDAELLVARLATAIGLSDEPAPQAELFWAVRRTLEHLARQQPAVVVFEDIHWAEPTFLDLLDHLADWSREAPLFLLVPARPELLDARSGWAGGKLNASTVLLESLPAEATARLIEALPGGSALPDALRARITTAAEGNPLFVEELLAMLVDDGVLALSDGQWHALGDLDRLAIPPTISALLAARLDRLSGDERRVAERASVVGRVFEPEAVAALSGETSAPDLELQLMALVRKELVRPDRSEVTGGDAFKFRHILIRDAAYNALPKRERAELHELFADWLEQAAGDRTAEFGEIIGHHLEQAHRYQTEVGGASSDSVAARAAQWLTAAAERSWERSDWASAAATFRRAADLHPLGRERLELLEQAIWALKQQGRYTEAIQAATKLEEDATTLGDEALGLRAKLHGGIVESIMDTGTLPQLKALRANVLLRAGELGDRQTALLAAYSQAIDQSDALRSDDAVHALRVIADEASANGWRALSDFAHQGRAFSGVFSSMSIVELRMEAAGLANKASGVSSDADVLTTEVVCQLLERGYTAAEPALARALSRYEEFGEVTALAVHQVLWAICAILTGEIEPAARLASSAVTAFQGVGNEEVLRTSQAVAGEAAALLGHVRDAEQLLSEAAQAYADDVVTHVTIHRARSRLALLGGDVSSARREIEPALQLLADVQSPLDEAETLIAWSEVHRAAGAGDQAREALLKARALMERKGATAVVRRIDRLVAALE